MSKLHISDTLLLPRDTVTSTIVVYGGKGMGKTNFASVVVEELSRLKLRWATLDPVGVWWGIRHAVDGKGPGVECLILGGVHGDIPIEPTGGAVVADLVVDEDVNVLIDFSRRPNGEAWGVGEKIRFVTEYGKRLYQRQSSLVNGRRREPLFQMVDEAARFIPQIVRAGQPELSICLSVWSQIVEEGRNAGLGVGLITQRSARLNKDVAELADAMCAFRTVGPNSVDAVMDWLGEHVPKERIKDIVEKLRSLPVGNCLVVSPGWLGVEEIVKIRERQTFNSSATPKPGESARKVTGKAAKPDLERYTARMLETIQRQKDNDPAVLKAKISELTRKVQEATQEASRARGMTVDDKGVEKAVEAALGRQQQLFNESIAKIRRFVVIKQDAVEEFAVRLRSLADDLQKLSYAWAESLKDDWSIQDVRQASFAGHMVRVDPKMRRNEVELVGGGPANVRITNLRVPSNGEVTIRAGARRMLAACVQWAPKAITEAQVAAQAGVKRTSGTFSTYKGLLVSEGLVMIRDGLWTATDAGFGVVGATAEPAPQTTEEVLAIWRPKLRGGARRMLDALVEARGQAMDVADLGAVVGINHTSGTFSTYLGNLVTADLVVKPERGLVAANKEVLFL